VTDKLEMRTVSGPWPVNCPSGQRHPCGIISTSWHQLKTYC